jgi:RNA polymerase sigma factor (sigma-70 family)
MHGEPAIAICDDSTLLEQWCDSRCDGAFEELVRKYERLVIGGVVRRTGDPELARDVAQQVFGILAQKARLLVGRPSIAGWLYQAATHITIRLQVSEARRLARHTVAGFSHPLPEEPWPLLEEALAKLGGSDREALVLHYFQDLSYPEMAASLGISEAAARKRVSRALHAIGVLLRKRGMGSPTALLAGAAALQASFTSQASAAGALAAPSAVSAPFPLLLNALMSHLSVKIAVCAAGLALLPLAYEWSANAALHAELAESNRPGAVNPVQASLPQSDHSAKLIAELRARVAVAKAERTRAEARAAELSTLAENAEDEVIVSLGTLDSMARTLGSTLNLMGIASTRRPGNIATDSPEWKAHEARMKEVVERMAECFSTLRELPRLERDPAKAARFYAGVVGEAAGLDEETRARLEQPLQNWMDELQAQGLAFPQRPKENTGEWDRRRLAVMARVSQELKAFLPDSGSKNGPLLDAFLLSADNNKVTEVFDVAFGKLP